MEQEYEQDQPHYYAVIPAEVRYHNKLSSDIKLLYCEITSLTDTEGVCRASNVYFANLYNTTTNTIEKWIASLKKYGFIKDVSKHQDSRELTIVMW